jgi:anti-anti-sigma regulatory factor
VSSVVSVTGEDFRGTAELDGRTLTMLLKGNADYAALDSLEMLLTRSHSEAVRLGANEVVVDLRQLEFMNSSCFKCFLSWINDIQELDVESRYKVNFLSSAQLHWQKRSLHSLRCFAVELITVTES